MSIMAMRLTAIGTDSRMRSAISFARAQAGRRDVAAMTALPFDLFQAGA